MSSLLALAKSEPSPPAGLFAEGRGSADAVARRIARALGPRNLTAKQWIETLDGIGAPVKIPEELSKFTLRILATAWAMAAPDRRAAHRDANLRAWVMPTADPDPSGLLVEASAAPSAAAADRWTRIRAGRASYRAACRRLRDEEAEPAPKPKTAAPKPKAAAPKAQKPKISKSGEVSFKLKPFKSQRAAESWARGAGFNPKAARAFAVHPAATGKIIRADRSRPFRSVIRHA